VLPPTQEQQQEQQQREQPQQPQPQPQPQQRASATAAAATTTTTTASPSADAEPGEAAAPAQQHEQLKAPLTELQEQLLLVYRKTFLVAGLGLAGSVWRWNAVTKHQRQHAFLPPRAQALPPEVCWRACVCVYVCARRGRRGGRMKEGGEDCAADAGACAACAAC
jgi:hypothetical protein